MSGYVEMMKAQGWKVYARGERFTYCFVTDGTNIAYVQWGHGRPSVSSVHIPNRKTGTGFHLDDLITVQTIQRAMACTAPTWARGVEVASVKKWENWDAFHRANTFNSELTER